MYSVWILSTLGLLFLLQLSWKSVHCATFNSPTSDFSGSSGNFDNGGRFQGNAFKAGRFSGSSTFVPTADDPFGEHQGSSSARRTGGQSRRDTSATFGSGSDHSSDMNGVDHDFGTSGSSGSNRGQADRSTDRDRLSGSSGSSGSDRDRLSGSSGSSGSSDRDRSSGSSDRDRLSGSSSSDRDRLSGSSSSSRNRNSDVDRPSRTGSTERPVEDTQFGGSGSSSGVDQGQVRNPSDRPECTDCRIRGLPAPIVETTTSKSFIARLFGKR